MKRREDEKWRAEEFEKHLDRSIRRDIRQCRLTLPNTFGDASNAFLTPFSYCIKPFPHCQKVVELIIAQLIQWSTELQLWPPNLTTHKKSSTISKGGQTSDRHFNLEICQFSILRHPFSSTSNSLFLIPTQVTLVIQKLPLSLVAS